MRTPTTTRIHCIATLFLLGLFHAPQSWADGAANPATSVDDTFTQVSKADEGPKSSQWDVYFSGYAYHDRDTYTDSQLHKMNETTWGGGLGRSMRTESGNEESIYAMGIRDSNRRPQWMAGYAYKWMFPLKSQGLEAGGGLTALLIKRHDWYNGRPFPALLPTASIGNRSGQLIATYVPHLSMRNKKGNILSLMLKFSK